MVRWLLLHVIKHNDDAVEVDFEEHFLRGCGKCKRGLWRFRMTIALVLNLEVSVRCLSWREILNSFGAQIMLASLSLFCKFYFSSFTASRCLKGMMPARHEAILTVVVGNDPI